MFDDPVKVAENEVCIFYSNHMTKGVVDYAKAFGINDVICLLAEQKSNPNEKEYVLIRNNAFIFAHTSYESVGAHINMIALSEGKNKVCDFV